MDLWVVVLAIVCFYGLRFSWAGHADYIDRGQTDSIKGIFAIIILYSHMRWGIIPPPSGSYDRLFIFMLNFLGQLMVVMFLLYSGYGIMESLKRNKEKYIKTFFTHRLVKVWLMFAIAVSLFCILNFVLDRSYPVNNYILCWIGWESVGNSNWFVFDILLLYAITNLVLVFADRCGINLKWVALSIYLLTFVMLVFLVKAGKETHWYDTILAYPAGMLYSLYKNRIEVLTRGWRWMLCALVTALVFAGFKYGFVNHFLSFSPHLQLVAFAMTSSVFALLVVLLTMKIKVDNKVLRWLGINAFSIYILQRLAMIVGTHLGLNQKGLIYAAFVIPVTLLLASIFTAVTGRINRKLFA